MSNTIEVDLDNSLLQLRELVRKQPLSEPEREKQYTNIRALKKVKSEWQRQRDEFNDLQSDIDAALKGGDVSNEKLKMLAERNERLQEELTTTNNEIKELKQQLENQ